MTAVVEKMDMKEAINRVASRKDLTREEASGVAEILLSGRATQAQIAAFLAGLRMKGETLDEIVGLADVLGQKAEHIHPKVDRYIDLVGTGGDRTFSFNISTTSAFVCVGAGLPIAKHGNRSISSKSGAGDVLEALGVKIALEPDQVEQCIEQAGIGFMFAQTFNKTMRFVGQARSEMGIRTVFNILGPLANPSNAKAMLVGVYDPALTETVVSAMKQLGVERALSVSGEDHMDEITLTGETTVSELKDGKVTTYHICPEDFGMKRVPLSELQGGTAQENAKITLDILTGQKGPKRDVVLLNAGAGLYIGGLSESIAEGVKMAEKSIDSGNAKEALDKLVECSNSL